jgi:drug/metabolite transporter (DMT)-like permease
VLWSGGLGGLGALSLLTLVKIFVFAAFFSALPSFLFIYVVREIGPVKANLVDFGQIIVGVVCGVFILNEWKGLKAADGLICWIGVVQIFLALAFDFSASWQAHRIDGDPGKGDNEKLLPEEL